MVQTLLDAGADPACRTEAQMTPLHKVTRWVTGERGVWVDPCPSIQPIRYFTRDDLTISDARTWHACMMNVSEASRYSRRYGRVKL